jgi:hypothetical protein
MKNLPTSALRIAALLAISSGLTLSTYAAANPKAGDRPNPKSSEPHPGDTRSAEGKAKAAAKKEATPEKSALDRYDANGNGKLDPDEVAAMQADKEKGATKKAKKDRS